MNNYKENYNSNRQNKDSQIKRYHHAKKSFKDIDKRLMNGREQRLNGTGERSNYYR